MKANITNKLIIGRAAALIFVLVANGMALGVCAACSGEAPYTPPQATIVLEAAPLDMDGAALYSEWQENPEATAAKYSGAKLYFKAIPVEQVDGEGELFIKDIPIVCQAAAPESIAKIKAGDMVDAVGVLSGAQDGRLVISDCWVSKFDPSKGGY